MLLFYVVLILGFGGFAITIPWLIHDEWALARQRRLHQAEWSLEREAEELRGALMQPGRHNPVASTSANSYRHCNFRYPHEVIYDATLSFDDKCSVLSAWASDMHAVESFPALRHLPGTPVPVTYASIMDARLQIDRLMSFGNDNDPTPPIEPARPKPIDYQMVA